MRFANDILSMKYTYGVRYRSVIRCQYYILKAVTQMFENKYNGIDPSIDDNYKNLLIVLTNKSLHNHKKNCKDLFCPCNVKLELEKIYKIRFPITFNNEEKKFVLNLLF